MSTDRLMHERAQPLRANGAVHDADAVPAGPADAGHDDTDEAPAAKAAAPLVGLTASNVHLFPTLPERHALPANDFLLQLRREVRRTMRSGAPLSLALYRVEGTGDRPARARQEARQETRDDSTLEALHRAKRETDLLGHVGDDLIAVLCPDTDAPGVASFVRKLDGRLGDRAGAAMVATFPDPVFQHLAEARGPAAARRLLDAARPSPHDASAAYPVKRLLDVTGALIALLLLSPLMLVVAALVKLSSPGPVIFRQTRLGHGGRPFTFYKFRSMRTDVDDRVHREFVAKLIAGQGGLEGGATAAPFKIERDPRITPIGAFLRRSSIDELPQFFNVLKGEMSLVGPRPAIPYETEHYQTWHLRRILTARPGITGLWQVEGRSRVTFNDMVRMDLRYIRECSLALDLRILLKTFVVVFRADGAA
jgi:lipopolysaccharide/colanic/teichoic acid biosynthesis glycosyltransferase